MSKCINCVNCDIKTYPSHAKTGYGRCKKETLLGVFESISINRQCDKFTLADGEALIERRGWWDRLKLLNKDI